MLQLDCEALACPNIGNITAIGYTALGFESLNDTRLQDVDTLQLVQVLSQAATTTGTSKYMHLVEKHLEYKILQEHENIAIGS